MQVHVVRLEPEACSPYSDIRLVSSKVSVAQELAQDFENIVKKVNVNAYCIDDVLLDLD